MKKILLFLSIILNLIACTESNQSSKAISDHQSQVAVSQSPRSTLEYMGTYEGTLLDSANHVVEVSIVLTDKYYQVKYKRLIEKANVIEQKGKYVWDSSGRIITLKNIRQIPSTYYVCLHQLKQFDGSRKIQMGDYTLRKRWNP